MKVGDLVTIAGPSGWGRVEPRCVGIVTCLDPEEIGDNEEVEVLWTSGFADRSNHSTWRLEVISAAPV
jgi:hypothetical protein